MRKRLTVLAALVVTALGIFSAGASASIHRAPAGSGCQYDLTCKA